MKEAIPLDIHIGIRVTQGLFDRLEAQAYQEERSIAFVMRKAAEEYLSARERASIEKEEVTG